MNVDSKLQFAQLRPTWDFAEFDCFVEYIIPNMQSVVAVMMDPEFQESVKDQEDWVDTQRALVSAGFITPYLLETGEVVNLSE
jgi:hypothetical protein